METMEGRLMLSTNVADLVSMDSPAAGYIVVATEMQAVAIGGTDYSAFNEGGFVTYLRPAIQEGGLLTYVGPAFHYSEPARSAVLHDSVSVGLWSDSLFAGDALRWNSDLGVLGIAPVQPGVLLGRLNGFGADLDAHAFSDFNAHTLPTAGIPILVISPNSSDATVPASSPSPLADVSQELLGDGEGGEIPIQSIIASIGPGANPSMNGPVIAKTSNGGNPVPTTRLVASRGDDGRIYSELARPVMIELAGGEPRGHDYSADANRIRHSDSSHDRAIPDPPYSSERNSEASAIRSAQYRAAQTSNQDFRTTSIVDHASADDARLSSSDSKVVDPMGVRLASITGEFENVPSDMAEATPASGAIDAFEHEHAAHDAIFGQLSVNDVAATHLLKEEDIWGTPLKATSLLMILALERITTANARRGKPSTKHGTASPNKGGRGSMQELDRK